MRRDVWRHASRLREIVRELPSSKDDWVLLADELKEGVSIKGLDRAGETEILQLWHCIERTGYGFDVGKEIAAPTFVIASRIGTNAVIPMAACSSVRIVSRTLFDRLIKTLLTPSVTTRLSFGAASQAIIHTMSFNFMFPEYAAIPILVGQTTKTFDSTIPDHIPVMNQLITILGGELILSKSFGLLTQNLVRSLHHQSISLPCSRSLLTTLLSQPNTEGSLKIVSTLLLKHEYPIPLLCLLSEPIASRSLILLGTSILDRKYHKMIQSFVKSPSISGRCLLIIISVLKGMDADHEDIHFASEIIAIAINKQSFVNEIQQSQEELLLLYSAASKCLSWEMWCPQLRSLLQGSDKGPEAAATAMMLLATVPKELLAEPLGLSLLGHVSRTFDDVSHERDGLLAVELLDLQYQNACVDPSLLQSVLNVVLGIHLTPKMSLVHIISIAECASLAMLTLSTELLSSIGRRIATKNIGFGGLNLSHFNSTQICKLLRAYLVTGVPVPSQLYAAFRIRISDRKVVRLESAHNTAILFEDLYCLVCDCSLPGPVKVQIVDHVAASFNPKMEEFNVFCDLLKTIVTQWGGIVDLSYLYSRLLRFLASGHACFNDFIPASLLISCIVLDSLVGNVLISKRIALRGVLRNEAYLSVANPSRDSVILTCRADNRNSTVLRSLNVALKKNNIPGRSVTYRLLENIGGLDRFQFMHFVPSRFTPLVELGYYCQTYLGVGIDVRASLDPLVPSGASFAAGLAASQLGVDDVLAADIADNVLRAGCKHGIREFCDLVARI
eukprot:TRINITY_DN16895_c0_g1_i1.p1 TRINITY_DN16895_c0_g1~~TRINITY_DN16895_c0_g1_i1.p1  ORF type:complete len:785 (+),score=73.23 TRINITY_DN16895_c0_g1_i1:85-2439(+)